MKSGQAELIQIAPLPQFVPSHACFTCSVCCRFPEPDSFLRPYFTEKEISQAIARGIDPARFSDPAGCQITVVPHPSGEGHLCPAFDPVTAHCRIYEVRPLDCQIYPLAVMWNEARTHVVLGWDDKCPWLGDGPLASGMPRSSMPARGLGGESIETYADRIADLLEREDTLEILASHLRLVGPFQDDVVILRPLPRLTARFVSQRSRLASTLRPLTLAARPRFEQALSATETPLAAHAFASHFIWRGLFTYWWAEFAGYFCLFAEYADGLYMPLPPLPLGGRAESTDAGAGLHAALTQAMALMRERNRGSAVTRIENVPEQMRPALESLDCRLIPKDSDYLYRASDLAELAGDRFKSQRAACNRFERERRYRYEVYEARHLDDCLALYRIWVRQQEERDLSAEAREILKDAESAHHQAFTHHADLGLIGRVVHVDGAIHAYTFGFELTASVFCVLFEVADRRIYGLAQFVFREFCREAAGRGCTFINTMDDSGLRSLAQSKRAYHPVSLVPNYALYES
jgi:Fe-S-cluster containining protein